MQPTHLQMRLNLAFLEGDQFLNVDSVRGTLDETPRRYRWESREVFNQIAPIYEVRISKLTRGRPELAVRPASGEQRDQASARTSKRILAANEQEIGWPSRYHELIAWMESTGTGITKQIWDPDRGRPVAVLQEEIEGQEPRSKTVREGDTDRIVVNPFTFYPDSPYRSNISECRSIIEARALPVDEIRRLWGVEVQEEPVHAITMQAGLGVGGHGYGWRGYRQGTDTLKGHAVVLEYWERPCAQYPNGRYAIVCRDKLLKAGPLPYQNGSDGDRDLPYTLWRASTVPGRLFGRSVIERIIPLQRAYNAVRNRKQEYMARVSVGQWFVFAGTVDEDQFEDQAGEPGAIHVVTQGQQPPQPVQFPSLPASFENEDETLLNEITIISGVSEIARKSEAPPGVKSGVALSIAVEQDDTRMAVTLANIEQAAVDSGKQMLRLYRQFAKGPRITRYVGADAKVDAIQWEASDLTSDDIIVENVAAMAQSRAQRIQMVFDLMDKGLYNDPDTGKITREGRQKLLEMIDLGTWEDGGDLDLLQLQKQQREIYQMIQGMPMGISEVDDDPLHLYAITRFMLSAEWEELLESNPQGAQLIEQHRLMHLDHFQQMQAMMAPPPMPLDPAQMAMQ